MTGVIVGHMLATRRARQRGMDIEKLHSFITWMLAGGFIGAHMLDEIFYHPSELLKRPWSLFFLWEGLSSFGGFIGAIIGALFWKYTEAHVWFRIPVVDIVFFKLKKRPRSLPILPFADLIVSVFPVAWIFGRSGCSVVHDHPGMAAPAGAWLAVDYPDRATLIALHRKASIALVHGEHPQFDMGLLELMFTVIVAAAFALTWKKRLTTGTYVAATALSYAPVRFAMDFLRLRDVDQADPRYGDLTPAQWMCLVLFAFGILMLGRVRMIRLSGYDPMHQFLVSAEPPYAMEPAPPVPTSEATSSDASR